MKIMCVVLLEREKFRVDFGINIIILTWVITELFKFEKCGPAKHLAGNIYMFA